MNDKLSTAMFILATVLIFAIITGGLYLSGINMYQYQGDVCLPLPVAKHLANHGINFNNVISTCGNDITLRIDAHSGRYYPDLNSICTERGFDIFYPYKLSTPFIPWISYGVLLLAITFLVIGIRAKIKGD
jgi:hypothetical protein